MPVKLNFEIAFKIRRASGLGRVRSLSFPFPFFL